MPEGISAQPLSPDAPQGKREPLQRHSCEGLGRDLRPCGEPLSGRQRRFHSDACRWRLWDSLHPRQWPLPLEPPLEPFPALNPTAPKERKRGLQRKCLLILGRLQQGPATNVELLQLGAGVRYGARIGELRDAGHRIRCEENKRTGLAIYTLEHP